MGRKLFIPVLPALPYPLCDVPGISRCYPHPEGAPVVCMLGYDADMMTVKYCRGFQ